MNPSTPTRVPHLSVLCATFAFLISATVPSDTTAAKVRLDAPAPHEIAAIEELIDWIEPGVLRAQARTVRDAVRERATSFELFRTYHHGEVRCAPLGALPYGEAICRAASGSGIDPLLVAAVIRVESRFDATAVSHKGAVGLMQVLPSTAGAAPLQLQDPIVNLEAGVRYLSWLLEHFDGDLELTLAGYNAGPTNVRRYGGVPPFAETQSYVEKVLVNYVELNRLVWLESAERELLLAEI